jgi:hypothetical protein
MSKKKNTLNDLEEFLKLQASSLVTPTTLTEKTSDRPVRTEIESKQQTENNISGQELAAKVKELARDKKAFYDLIITVTESLPDKSKEDVLLINTALYLKGGSSWKNAIRNYWETKK